MIAVRRPATLLALLAAAPAAAQPAGDAARGEARYEAVCSACHSIDRNRIGPLHRGVVGRKAGAVTGFAYSSALKKSGIVWTPANLDRWLSGPIKMVPGTRMGISVANAADRRDIIAWLASQGASGAAPRK